MPPLSVQYAPFSVQYAPLSVQYVPLSVHYAPFSVNYAPFSVQYAPLQYKMQTFRFIMPPLESIYHLSVQYAPFGSICPLQFNMSLKVQYSPSSVKNAPFQVH